VDGDDVDEEHEDCVDVVGDRGVVAEAVEDGVDGDEEEDFDDG